MINSLQKIKKAIPTKAIVPILAFIHIYKDESNDFRVQANNGKLAIDAPIDFPFEVTVNGDKFIRAINLCKGNTKFKITKTGRLSIISGKFRALIETTQDTFPRLKLNKNNAIKSTGNILTTCNRLKPFISDDASRLWSQSILFRENNAYATNNIILAKSPDIGVVDCVLPVYSVDSIIAIKKEPKYIIAEENYTGLYFDDNVWIRFSNSDTNWPDVDRLIVEAETIELPDNFLEHLENLVDFCEDPKYPIVYLNENGISSSSEGVGANIQDTQYPQSKFRMEMLLLVAKNATHVDFTTYPKPCYFTHSNGLVGVIMGLK